MDKNKSYLAIISCKSGKMDYACEAKELYSKNVFFREQFAFLEAAYDKILIASAKYDLILPTKIIEPYELSFDERVRVNKIRNIAGNEYKKQWGIKVKNQIEKVIDTGVREILKIRLIAFNGDAQKAFTNLDENPIWLNRKAGITIKSVRISGVNNVEALHSKKDHFGNSILDLNGKPIYVEGETNRRVSTPIITDIEIDTDGNNNTLKTAKVNIKVFTLKKIVTL